MSDRKTEESDEYNGKAWSTGTTQKPQNSLLEEGIQIDTARVRAASVPESGQ